MSTAYDALTSRGPRTALPPTRPARHLAMQPVGCVPAATELQASANNYANAVKGAK